MWESKKNQYVGHRAAPSVPTTTMTNVDFGKFSWWYWIVAFVVVVVILLIIVIGVCMHRCKVHQERARQGNNNGTGGLDEPILDADDMEALITSV